MRKDLSESHKLHRMIWLNIDKKNRTDGGGSGIKIPLKVFDSFQHGYSRSLGVTPHRRSPDEPAVS